MHVEPPVGLMCIFIPGDLVFLLFRGMCLAKHKRDCKNTPMTARFQCSHTKYKKLYLSSGGSLDDTAVKRIRKRKALESYSAVNHQLKTTLKYEFHSNLTMH